MSNLISSVDAFSHQGFKGGEIPNHYNEDRIVTGTQIFAVIDGATSVIAEDMNGLNSSAYTSQYLADFLYANDLPDTRTAYDLLLEANHAFREHLEVCWPNVMAMGKLGPCASVALIKIHPDGTISTANVSDCAIAMLKDNKWELISKHCPRHVELDNELAESIFEKIDQGTPVSEVLQLSCTQDHIKKNRMLLNIEYGVFNAEPEMKEFLAGNMLDAKGITAFALLSDGMHWPESVGEEGACISAAERMYNAGVYGYYQELKALKGKDPDFVKFRRLKHMDDASGVVIRLKNAF